MNEFSVRVLFTHIQGLKASIVAFSPTRKRPQQNSPEGQGDALSHELLHQAQRQDTQRSHALAPPLHRKLGIGMIRSSFTLNR
jgi:hypothetical protein